MRRFQTESATTCIFLRISPALPHTVRGEDQARRRCCSCGNVPVWRAGLPVRQLCGDTLRPNSSTIPRKEGEADQPRDQLRHFVWDYAAGGRSGIRVPDCLVHNAVAELRASPSGYISNHGKQWLNVVCGDARASAEEIV